MIEGDISSEADITNKTKYLINQGRIKNEYF